MIHEWLNCGLSMTPDLGIIGYQPVSHPNIEKYHEGTIRMSVTLSNEKK